MTRHAEKLRVIVYTWKLFARFMFLRVITSEFRVSSALSENMYLVPLSMYLSITYIHTHTHIPRTTRIYLPAHRINSCGDENLLPIPYLANARTILSDLIETT